MEDGEGDGIIRVVVGQMVGGLAIFKVGRVVHAGTNIAGVKGGGANLFRSPLHHQKE